MPIYVRRRRKRKTMAKWLRGKLMGLAFIALAVLILGVFGWFATITPDYYIYVTESGLGAGSTLPANVTGSVSIKAIVGIIVGFADVLLVVSAIRRLGIHM